MYGLTGDCPPTADYTVTSESNDARGTVVPAIQQHAPGRDLTQPATAVADALEGLRTATDGLPGYAKQRMAADIGRTAGEVLGV